MPRRVTWPVLPKNVPIYYLILTPLYPWNLGQQLSCEIWGATLICAGWPHESLPTQSFGVFPAVLWKRTQALLVGSPTMHSLKGVRRDAARPPGHQRTRASLATAQRFPGRALGRTCGILSARAERTIRPARRGCKPDARTRGPPTAPGPLSPAGSRGA